MALDLIKQENDLLKDFLDDWTNNSFINNYKNLMKTDIQENDESYIFTIELPGFKKEDIKISLDDEYLLIEAQNKSNQTEKQNMRYLKQERFKGFLQRRFYLGNDFKIEDIKGNFEEGLLKINIPKKSIQIKQKKYISIK